jgi:hypothetical protein
LDKFGKLRDLTHAFIAAAKHYGKIIIVEKYLPVEKKTIKPLTNKLGGLGKYRK